MMLKKTKMCYRLIIVLILQATRVFAAPLQIQPIFVAQPQVMMHTLQQPIPFETLHSFKTQDLQNKPVKNEISTVLPTYQPKPNRLHPMNLEHLQSTLIEGQEQTPLVPILYQQMELEQQQMALQEQMMALQHLQSMQLLNTVHSEVPWLVPQEPQPQPMLIFLPEPEENENTNQNEPLKKAEKYKFEENELKHEEGYLNEDLDSVIVDGSDHNDKVKTRKAILLIPNARFIIGDIISTIPWLPIHVNVPDTIAWVWNGITGGIGSIISNIGSRLPFRLKPQAQVPVVNMEEPNVKAFLKQLQMRNQEPLRPVVAMPLYAMPIDGIPIQI